MREFTQKAPPPPKSVVGRLQGSEEAVTPPAPDFPLCAMGPRPYCAALALKEVEPAPWREVEFDIGRRRDDMQYSAAWHSLFETFAPIDRALGPVYRLLLSDRANRLRAVRTADADLGAAGVASKTALCAIALPAFARGVERLIRAYVGETPDPVVRAMSVRPELLNLSGPPVLEPPVVLPGMIFAAVARASYSA